ncbi:MAG: LysM peptidoglycan-binding domain-containing protein [Gemmatimonadaceae bacterium]|nr:LysM peptidoglycan-binding domain-containing protein [Gemmatimonadaceae bacterium]
MARNTVAPLDTLRTIVAGPARSRRWWLRLVARLTGTGLGLVVLAGALFAWLVSLRPDVPAARRLAQQELALVLEANERVVARTWAARRAWWDGFRETYGILALTDRRVIFVGIPPRELVSPDRGPQEFVVLQLPVEGGLTGTARRVDLGTAAGLELRHDDRRLVFASADPVATTQLLATIAGRRGQERAADSLAAAARDYERRVAAREVWHVVAPGDALSSIAARYGTTEERLVAWNRLATTRIRIGQRLLVKPATPRTATAGAS